MSSSSKVAVRRCFLFYQRRRRTGHISTESVNADFHHTGRRYQCLRSASLPSFCFVEGSDKGNAPSINFSIPTIVGRRSSPFSDSAGTGSADAFAFSSSCSDEDSSFESFGDFGDFQAVMEDGESTQPRVGAGRLLQRVNLGLMWAWMSR